MPRRLNDAIPRIVIILASKRSKDPNRGGYAFSKTTPDSKVTDHSERVAGNPTSKQLLLGAVIAGVSTIQPGDAAVVISTDSMFVKVARELAAHRRNNFRSLENADFWRKLDELMATRSIIFAVLGLTKRERNEFERVQKLAKAAISREDPDE